MLSVEPALIYRTGQHFDQLVHARVQGSLLFGYLFERQALYLLALQGDHDAGFPIFERGHRARTQLAGQNAVEGARAAAGLKMVQNRQICLVDAINSVKRILAPL